MWQTGQQFPVLLAVSSKKDQTHLVLPQVHQWLIIYPLLSYTTIPLQNYYQSSTQRQLYIYTYVIFCMVHVWFRAEIFQHFITWIIFQYGQAVTSYAFEATKATA